jgi:hypothetical protein
MKLHNKLYDEYVNAHAGFPNIEGRAFAFAKAETQRNWQSVVVSSSMHLSDQNAAMLKYFFAFLP